MRRSTFMQAGGDCRRQIGIDRIVVAFSVKPCEAMQKIFSQRPILR